MEFVKPSVPQINVSFVARVKAKLLDTECCKLFTALCCLWVETATTARSTIPDKTL